MHSQWLTDGRTDGPPNFPVAMRLVKSFNYQTDRLRYNFYAAAVQITFKRAAQKSFLVAEVKAMARWINDQFKRRRRRRRRRRWRWPKCQSDDDFVKLRTRSACRFNKKALTSFSFLSSCIVHTHTHVRARAHGVAHLYTLNNSIIFHRSDGRLSARPDRRVDFVLRLRCQSTRRPW